MVAPRFTLGVGVLGLGVGVLGLRVERAAASIAGGGAGWTGRAACVGEMATTLARTGGTPTTGI